MDWKLQFLNQGRFRETTSDEAQKPNHDQRFPVERDLGRSIFSPACRRLHDKTQVFPLTTDDNIHSRLTHSLEVMNTGLSFALNLSNYDIRTNKKKWSDRGLKDPFEIYRLFGSILQVICLIHDIGNPPFGHFGEQSIQIYFSDLFQDLRNNQGLGSFIRKNIRNTSFITKQEKETQKRGNEEEKQIIQSKCKIRKQLIEDSIDEILKNEGLQLDYTAFDGNAEGFRVITKLQYAGDLFGLNLTKCILAASIKYPNPWNPNADGHVAYHKHGVLTTEIPQLEKLADECGLRKEDGSYKRHPLCFLMEAADSICYMVMDIEDAILKGWINIETDVLPNVKDYSFEGITINERYLKIAPQGKDNDKKNLGRKCIALRSALLAYLVAQATDIFMRELPNIEKGDYPYELLEYDPVAKELSKITKKKILCHREIMSLEVTGDAVIKGIFDAYIRMLFSSDKGYRDRGKCLLSHSIFKAILAEHVERYKDLDVFKGKYSETNIEKLYEEFDVADFTVEERFRLIRDFIAGMTDQFALTHFQCLSGQKI